MGVTVCKAIVAVSQNGVIGKGGELPWRLPEDLKWFRKITMGHIILMGRKTWESLKGPLPGRQNWVLSRKMKPTEGIRVFGTIEEALSCASGKTIFVIGGGELYVQTLSLCKELYVTEVMKMISDGDTYFPDFKNDFIQREIMDGNDDFVLRRWERK